MGPSGPVGLNMLAINQAMDDYNIDDDERVDFSFTVRKIAGTIISEQMDEAERKAKKGAK